MRDRTAIAVLAVAFVVGLGGYWFLTADLPAEDAPDADFEVTDDIAADTIVVEHAGGQSIPSESLRILVYEDRWVLPDRTVHGTIWESDTGAIQPGDRIELEDPRFEPGQRVVVRWFGDDGRANLHETTLG